MVTCAGSFPKPRSHMAPAKPIHHSRVTERAMSSQIDAYVGGGGSEWASGDTDPDDDFYVPDGGSDGDDYGA